MKIKPIKLALVLLCTVAFMAACVDEGEEIVDWKAGNSLLIAGNIVSGSSATTEASSEPARFYVIGYTVDKTYNWTLNESPVEATRGGEYANVVFEQPGEYTLQVSDGTINPGVVKISVSSAELSLGANAGEGLEGDTISVPVTISSPAATDVSLTYSISGTATAGTDYTLLSANPLVIPKGSTTATIRLAVSNDMEAEGADTVAVKLESLTSEAVELPETAPTFTYTILEDDKVVSFEATDTLELNGVADADVYTFNVMLSRASTEEVSVDYTISSATGITVVPASPMVFQAGQTSQTLAVEVSEAAFSGNQTITIELDGVTASDEEVSLSEDEMMTEQVIVINTQ